jgi:hypothetical protein
LLRACSVENIHLIRAPLALRFLFPCGDLGDKTVVFTDATIEALARQNPISTMLSQLACLGV